MPEVKRQDPSKFNQGPFDFRTERSNFQRARAIGGQPVNDDSSLSVVDGDDTFLFGVYSKCMPHNSLGEVLDSDWNQLTIAMQQGEQESFDAIPLAPGAVRRLVNPQAAIAFGDPMGPDSHGLDMPQAPDFLGQTTSAEMVELAGMALARQESFSDIAAGTTSIEPIITDLIAELNAFGTDYQGRTPVDRGNLFRGTSVDTDLGPYASQLFQFPFNYGNLRVNPQVDREDDTADSTSRAGFLDILNCQVNPPPNRSGDFEFVFNGQTGGSYVHNDAVIESSYNASLILLQAGAPLDPGLPSFATTEPFVTQGGCADIWTHLAHVCRKALEAAWRQKWAAAFVPFTPGHLRIRPETAFFRLDTQKEGLRAYGLPASTTGSGTVASLNASNIARFSNDTCLLPLIFPEGSPTHPAYPAGHSLFAGAAATVLKCFFDTDATWASLGLPTLNPTGPNTQVDLGDIGLTVNSELNKLAENIATFRNWAGVHYRSDGDQGILLGERVAISYMRDVAAGYNLKTRTFEGFNLQRFNGDRIVVSPR